ncbi:MAG: four helix bundle protein [Chitinispirillales bacterium]|nr:four helix bundle protein [Chitinispirillales bacterium]
MTAQKNELTVIMKAKDLCTYIVNITQKSPKQFRFTFVARMQNLAMDIIEAIYRANEVFIGAGNPKNAEKRLDLQHNALTLLKLLAYFSEIAMIQNCILPKQYEQIAKLTVDCQRLVGAWINSEKKRLPS